MMYRTFFLISLIALLPSTAYTGIYKWTDENGKVHYSQTKPTDTQTESMTVSGAKPGYAQSHEEKNADKKVPDETKEKNDKVQQPVARAEEEKPKKSRSACLAAKKNLQQIQSTGRVRKRDSQGNVTYLSEQQKQAEIKKAQKVIKQNC